MLEIELPFTNPFRHTTMLGYNPRKVSNRIQMIKNKSTFKCLRILVTGQADPEGSSTLGMGETS